MNRILKVLMYQNFNVSRCKGLKVSWCQCLQVRRFWARMSQSPRSNVVLIRAISTRTQVLELGPRGLVWVTPEWPDPFRVAWDSICSSCDVYFEATWSSVGETIQKVKIITWFPQILHDTVLIEQGSSSSIPKVVPGQYENKTSSAPVGAQNIP